jgi:hypothetical protein
MCMPNRRHGTRSSNKTKQKFQAKLISIRAIIYFQNTEGVGCLKRFNLFCFVTPWGLSILITKGVAYKVSICTLLLQ